MLGLRQLSGRLDLVVEQPLAGFGPKVNGFYFAIRRRVLKALAKTGRDASMLGHLPYPRGVF